MGLVFIIAAWLGGAMIIGLPYFIADIEIGSNTDKLSLYLFLLASFLPLVLGLWLVTRFWHKDAFLKVFTSAQKFRWGYFGRAAIIVLLATSIITAIDYLIDPESYQDYKLNTNLSLYWKISIITLLLVPFQAASEELLLRGYLSRALGRYIKNPWIIFFITSAGFSALHIGNPEATGQLWPYLMIIFLFGFFMCVLLYFEGGLESAISFHIFNNIFAFGIIGYSDPELPESSLIIGPIPDIVWIDTILMALFMGTTCALIIWTNRKWGTTKDTAII